MKNPRQVALPGIVVLNQTVPDQKKRRTEKMPENTFWSLIS
jgi:hypothetical protein